MSDKEIIDVPTAVKSHNVIDVFNDHFKGDAKIEIKSKTLSITVGSRSIEIALPAIIGASCVGPKD